RWNELTAAGDVSAGLTVRGSEVVIENAYLTHRADAVGMRLLVSHDDGKRFVSHPSPGHGLGCRFSLTSASTIWGFCATGNFGQVIRSVNDGKTFNVAAPQAINYRLPNCSAFAAASDSTAVVGASASLPGRQALARTTNAGRSYHRLGPTDMSWSYLGFTDGAHGAAIGAPANGGTARLYDTTNGGRSYRPVKTASVTLGQAWAHCAASRLSVRELKLHSGPAGETRAVVLTNVSRAGCRIGGVPRLALLDSRGAAIYTPPQVVASHGASFRLRPHRSASFWVDLLAPQGQPVAGAQQLGITLAGGGRSIHVPLSAPDRTSQQLIVSAVAPGVVAELPASVHVALRCKASSLSLSVRTLGLAAGSSYNVSGGETGNSAEPEDYGIAGWPPLK
ncbi:MAG: DUF4232 domain-containing protein, partial [Solirubrobacteraceae bacterium]